MRRKPIKKSLITTGMCVSCIEREEAYYSGFNGNPEVWFEPGDVGYVVSVDVVCVTYAYQKREGTATFVRVEFDKLGKVWSAALYYNNIVLLEENA